MIRSALLSLRHPSEVYAETCDNTGKVQEEFEVRRTHAPTHLARPLGERKRLVKTRFKLDRPPSRVGLSSHGAR